MEWLHIAERILRILANQQTFGGRHEDEDGGRTLQSLGLQIGTVKVHKSIAKDSLTVVSFPF